MRVAVLGAGVAGLAAARRLARDGHSCDVYERWPGLGGQVASMEIPGGDRLEHYYHHLFTTDREIVALYEELGMGGELEWLPSSVAVFAEGRSWPFTTPGDLLRFGPLSPWARIRTGIGALALQRFAKSPDPFEDRTAQEMVERWMGPGAWRDLWGPLLRAKFGSRYERISAAWLWSKLTLRRRIDGDGRSEELLGYPRGGWQPLLERLRDEIEARGGTVLIDRPARSLGRGADGRLTVTPGRAGSFREGHDPARFAADEAVPYDAVVATVPSPIFSALLEPALEREVGAEYLGKVSEAEYHTAVCLVLELDRSLTPFYWTNVIDPEVRFLGLIEHTNLVPPERYDGRRFLYVANYVEPGDPIAELDPEQLLAHYGEGLRRVNPAYERSWVRSLRLYREPAAQPVVTPGYRARLPELETPAPGLYLANTIQIYPEDRGTNYSVRLGDQVAAAVAGAD